MSRIGYRVGEPFQEIPLSDIRNATCNDAKKLSQVAEQVFRATFGAANTPEDMRLHCERSYSEASQASEISDPSMCTLVSEHEGELIGFAQLRWGRAPACVIARWPAEIYRLYVVAAWHGRGIAQTLMDASLEEMKRHESDIAWLGVWERNPRAISFYNKCGFVEVGAHDFLLGADLQRDIVMVRSVPGMTSGLSDSIAGDS
jgi:ribosomal protein S18 acetylase RimI-like enzyme